MTSTPLKIAVLIGGSGRTLQNFIDLRAAGHLDVDIPLVIASRDNLTGIDKARRADLATVVIDRRAHASTAAFSDAIFAACDAAAVDLICLAGWLRLLEIPTRYLGRTMNIHPALLPSFGGHGMYGHHVHEAVLAHGCKISGCTAHFVDNAYDNGPIILQRTCPVLEDDTPDALAARVFEEEKAAYPQALRLFAADRLTIEGRRVRIT